MNETDRLHQYLQDRADMIALPEPEPAGIALRARRRRTVRLTGTITASVIVVLGAIALISSTLGSAPIDLASDHGTSSSLPAAAALRWTTVDVPDGLGWSVDTVTMADGSLYGLSTAPGPDDPNATAPKPSVLYRSADGRSWQARTLPTGLSPTALATAGGNLYAVGTAPAGGNVDLVVAASTDGAATWTAAHIPAPAAELRARYPNRISISSPVITTGSAGIVAAVVVRADPDAARLLAPLGVTSENQYQITVSGVDVFAALPPNCDGPTTGTTPPGDASATPPSTIPSGGAVPAAPPGTEGPQTTGSGPASASAAAKRSVDCKLDPSQRAVTARYTWEQLGLDPALRPLVQGQVHLYHSTDGSTFDDVTPTGTLFDGAGEVNALVGGSDGFRMVLDAADHTSVRQVGSADGRTWASTGPDLSGWVQTSGTLVDRPAIVLTTPTSVQLLTAAPGGGWATTDLGRAVGFSTDENRPAAFQTVGFGRLGLVGILLLSTDPEHPLIVESRDGQTFTRRPVTELAGPGPWDPTGVVMNADAVTIRLAPIPAPDATRTTPPGPERLLVGTPG